MLGGMDGPPDDGFIWPAKEEEELEEVDLLRLRLRRAERHIQWQSEVQQNHATWRAYLQEQRTLQHEAAREALHDRAVAAEDQAADALLEVQRLERQLQGMEEQRIWAVVTALKNEELEAALAAAKAAGEEEAALRECSSAVVAALDAEKAAARAQQAQRAHAAELARMREALQGAEAERALLEQQVRQVDVKRAQQAQRAELAEAQLEAAAAQAAEVQRLLVQAQQEAAAVDGALCAEVAGVAAACQAMQAQLQQALEAAADWQGQTEQLQQQVGELQQQIVQLQEERGQLQEQVGELQQQLTAAASELPALPEGALGEPVRKLGGGAFGDVHEHRVAVKTAKTAEEESCLRAEAATTARCAHPRIVRAIATISIRVSGAQRLGLVLEMAAAGNLMMFLIMRKLSAADVVVMGADIAEALLHVHLRGLAHKDVKPQNILLGRDQQGRLRAKLCDFDLAQALAQTRAAAGRCTPFYEHPRTAVCPVSCGSHDDVYALGVSLYNAASAELLQDLLVAQARALLAIRRARTFLRGYCREHQLHIRVAAYDEMGEGDRDDAIAAALSAGLLRAPPLQAREGLEGLPAELPALLEAIFDPDRWDAGVEVTMAEVLSVLAPLRDALLPPAELPALPAPSPPAPAAPLSWRTVSTISDSRLGGSGLSSDEEDSFDYGSEEEEEDGDKDEDEDEDMGEGEDTGEDGADSSGPAVSGVASDSSGSASEPSSPASSDGESSGCGSSSDEEEEDEEQNADGSAHAESGAASGSSGSASEASSPASASPAESPASSSGSSKKSLRALLPASLGLGDCELVADHLFDTGG